MECISRMLITMPLLMFILTPFMNELDYKPQSINTCFQNVISVFVVQIAYQDYAAYLMTSETSLTDLNEKTDENYTMDRFRGNIIVSGIDEPWQEVHAILYLMNTCSSLYLHDNYVITFSLPF